MLQPTDLFLDTETFSPVNLNSRGLMPYAAQGEVMLLSWATEHAPVSLWDRSYDDQESLFERLLVEAEDCTRVIAHNSGFDQTMIETDPKMRPLADRLAGKWYCTMAMALRHGLPGGLEKLCHVFKLPEDLYKISGKEFINLFCKVAKGEPRATRFTHPEKWAEFRIYAEQDIRAMREIYYMCPSWNDSASELRLWALDQKINRRGVGCDVKFATQAVRACKAEQDRLADQTQDLTSEFALRATQRDRLLQFIFVEHGVTLPDLRQDTVERRLEDPELPPLLKELLRVRLSSSKASTSKYKRVLDLQFAGRMYWLLQYCGAIRTKRWAGRNFQPQNLKRPAPWLKYPLIEEAIEAVMCGSEDLLLPEHTPVKNDDDEKYSSYIMEAMSGAVRSVLVAAQGHKLIGADLSNIEGRDLPWLAGEEWKLQMFRDFDRGIGQDLYKVVYGNAFNVDPADVDGFQRQIGKVLELAFAIGGGVGACVTAAATYKIDLEVLAAAVHATASREYILDAEGVWEWAKRKHRTLGLAKHVYVACEVLKRMWRDAHPATVRFWDECGAAAECALRGLPGAQKVGQYIEFDKRGVWLRMKLPNGSYLSYPNAKIEYDEDSGMPTITYMTWNVYRKGWYRERTWGSKFASDARQAVAREVMAAAMQPAEDAGYPIVLTVHDELLTETPDSPRYTADGLSAILATNQPWNAGLPLAADGHEMYRYHKRD